MIFLKNFKNFKKKGCLPFLNKQCAINTDGKLLLLGDELCGSSS